VLKKHRERVVGGGWKFWNFATVEGKRQNNYCLPFPFTINIFFYTSQDQYFPEVGILSSLFSLSPMG
jgi:hypothetical protein